MRVKDEATRIKLRIEKAERRIKNGKNVAEETRRIERLTTILNGKNNARA